MNIHWKVKNVEFIFQWVSDLSKRFQTSIIVFSFMLFYAAVGGTLRFFFLFFIFLKKCSHAKVHFLRLTKKLSIGRVCNTCIKCSKLRVKIKMSSEIDDNKLVNKGLEDLIPMNMGTNAYLMVPAQVLTNKLAI